jgi:hypothetical protein
VLSGDVIGYDPGGDGTHGLAILRLEAGRAVSTTTVLCETAEEVISRVSSMGQVLALGTDTLTCWSTGRCGWRPADRWLIAKYPKARKSIVSPNGLYGAMGLNGMAVLISLKTCHPTAQLTETHPKVLYWGLAQQKYDWSGRSTEMSQELSNWLLCGVRVKSEDEWDAALSAYAAMQGLIGRWTFDLHTLPTYKGERLITPAGRTHYFWPT